MFGLGMICKNLETVSGDDQRSEQRRQPGDAQTQVARFVPETACLDGRCGVGTSLRGTFRANFTEKRGRFEWLCALLTLRHWVSCFELARCLRSQLRVGVCSSQRQRRADVL